MRRSNHWLLLLLASSGFLLTGCESESEKVVEEEPLVFTMDFLVGSWQNLSETSSHFEEWEKVDDAFYRGKGFVMSNSDTIFIEELSILNVNGRWLYSARVADQNDNESIAFREVSFTEKGIAFENTEHDFPQRISYELNGPNAVIASISGMNDGELKETVFLFDRILE